MGGHTMEKQKALNILSRVIEGIAIVRCSQVNAMEFVEWHTNTKEALRMIFGEGSSELSELSSIRFAPDFETDEISGSDCQRWFIRGLESAETILSSIKDEIDKYWPDNLV